MLSSWRRSRSLRHGAAPRQGAGGPGSVGRLKLGQSGVLGDIGGDGSAAAPRCPAAELSGQNSPSRAPGWHLDICQNLLLLPLPAQCCQLAGGYGGDSAGGA